MPVRVAAARQDLETLERLRGEDYLMLRDSRHNEHSPSSRPDEHDEHGGLHRDLSETATAVSNKIAASQIALPLAANNLLYATSGYEASKTNQARITVASDNVFSDGTSLELATVSGDRASGMAAVLTVGI